MGSRPNSLRLIFDAYNSGSPEDRERMRLIGVMGLTGSGKSTFIKRLTDDDSIIIGHNIYSETVDVGLSRMNFLASNNKSYDVFLADTPGFDDSTRSDTNVLESIVTWLGAMQEINIKLSGIIYLHRITDDRVSGISRRNLHMLQNLVGADKMRNVFLVSTRWEEQPQAEPDAWRARMEERQEQIEQGFVDHSGNTHQGFWQTYIQNGAHVMRHNGSIDSARRIVDNIIVRCTPVYIQIQDEVLDGKDLSETAAGQAIMSDLERTVDSLREELANLDAEMEEVPNRAGDEYLLRQQLEEEISSVQNRMNSMLAQESHMFNIDNQKLKARIKGLVLLGLGAFALATGRNLDSETVASLMRLFG